MSEHSLTLKDLERFLQPILAEVVAGARSLSQLTEPLTALPRHQQERVLHWIDVIAKTNAELAFQYALHVPRAFRSLTSIEIDQWVLNAMHVYDHHGLFASIHQFEHLDQYLAEKSTHAQTASLDSIKSMLEIFVQGLNGRRLAIEAGAPNDRGWTDTETIYLPNRIAYFNTTAKNLSVFKCTAALLWAQTRFGTFSLLKERKLKLLALDKYEDPARAREIFQSFESERLLFQIEQELPGLAREMHSLIPDRQIEQNWAIEIEKLKSLSATVDHSLLAVAQIYPGIPPEKFCFQGELQTLTTEKTIQMRISREQEELKQALNLMLLNQQPELNAKTSQEIDDEAENRQINVSLQNKSADDQFNFDLSFRGASLSPSAEVQQLLQSILQDLGEIPLDYLVAAGPSDGSSPKNNNIEIPQSDEEVIDGLPYPEWDFRRRHYRHDWCYLRELEGDEGESDFVQKTLSKYAAVLPQLRKSFEALRGEDKWLRRQLDGDEIDLDALIESLADMNQGMELSDRLYTRLSRIDRNIAVVFMVDMSGSTKGWVNDAERESLVLLCQALEILGDRYAIYGFSGMTRKRCELFRIKKFDEPYSPAVERRISGIKAKDYTRMGVTIRHLNKLLEQTSAKTKMLITLSDGKPEDFDGYGGEYGIEDTRQALIETRQLGIHPFCITIDTEASSYLPHMYGAHRYAVVDDVRSLPLRVAEVYRRLTL